MKSNSIPRNLFLVVLTVLPSTWAQKPVISPGGVVNAASYSRSATSTGSHAIVGGSVVTILGQNLATTTQTANTIPLPTTLGGTTVYFAGIPVPLFYVSPTQINLEVPNYATSSTSGSAAKGITVVTAVGSSDPYTVDGSDSTLGIFTLDGSGCGRGAIYNITPDGTVSLNSPSNSVSPGDYLSVYGTGLGVAYGALLRDGYPTPLTPLTSAANSSIGVYDFAVDFFITNHWGGRAPGLIGVDQINVQVPTTVREGCAVPFQIWSLGISQPVIVAVRKGGGPCIDPPLGGFGQILWEKSVRIKSDNTSTETDTVTTSLQTAPGQRVPPVPAMLLGQGGGPFLGPYYGAACPIPGYRSLGAGKVNAQTPGFGPVASVVSPMPQGHVELSPVTWKPVPLGQVPVSGLSVYQASLPVGTVQSGKFSVTAEGGADVTAFQSVVTIGSEPTFTTKLAGMGFQCNREVSIHWTGGDPDAWLTATLVTSSDDSHGVYYVYQAPVSDGILPIVLGPASGTSCTAVPYIPATLIIEVTPDPSKIATFSAPGLSLGGQHLWKYTYIADVLITLN